MSTLSPLEERIAALENEFASVKKYNGIPGPRGPAGSISAATANAEAVVGAAESRLRGQFDARQRELNSCVELARGEFDKQIDALREEVRTNRTASEAAATKLRQYVDKHFASVIDAKVLEVLQAYGVLDENMNVKK